MAFFFPLVCGKQDDEFDKDETGQRVLDVLPRRLEVLLREGEEATDAAVLGSRHVEDTPPRRTCSGNLSNCFRGSQA